LAVGLASLIGGASQFQSNKKRKNTKRQKRDSGSKALKKLEKADMVAITGKNSTIINLGFVLIKALILGTSYFV